MLAKYICSAVILRCPISPGKYDYEPPKHKMPPFSQNNFFSTFLIFFRTKAIHSYVLAKFEKISVLLFSTKVLQTTTLKILRYILAKTIVCLLKSKLWNRYFLRDFFSKNSICFAFMECLLFPKFLNCMKTVYKQLRLSCFKTIGSYVRSWRHGAREKFSNDTSSNFSVAV